MQNIYWEPSSVGPSFIELRRQRWVVGDWEAQSLSTRLEGGELFREKDVKIYWGSLEFRLMTSLKGDEIPFIRQRILPWTMNSCKLNGIIRAHVSLRRSLYLTNQHRKTSLNTQEDYLLALGQTWPWAGISKLQPINQTWSTFNFLKEDFFLAG